jgi:integrase
LRGRIENILNTAKVHGWRTGENPAQWRGHLSSILRRRQKLVKTHHGTLPFEDVPAFLMALRSWALTAARMGEVLGTTWDEGDLVQPVPSCRMKAGIADREPLSVAPLAVSAQAAEMDDFGREVEA